MAKRRGNTNARNSQGADRRGEQATTVRSDARDEKVADAANGAPAEEGKHVDGASVDTTAIVAGADVIEQPADSAGLKDGGIETEQSGTVENGKAAAPGAAEDGSNTSGAKDNVSGDQSNASGADPASGTGQQANGGSNDASKASGGDGSADIDRDGNVASPTGSDLKEALELAGCESADQLIDMARVGSSLMNCIDDVIKQDGPFKDWSPMNDPAEIVHDLHAALEHAKEQAAVPEVVTENVRTNLQHCRMCDEPLTPAHCPICDDPFKGSDLCATDIELGTCHAECLEGSPVVDLMTGEPSGKANHTFLYYEDGIEEMHSSVVNAAYVMRDIAWNAATDIADQFAGIQVDLDIRKVGSPFTDEAIDKELVEFTHRLGRNATPDVLATQLMIKKLRDSNELTTPERIALQTFITVLLDLDEYAAAEKARIDAEATEKPTPRPVPIEDTTMELVDDHDATW
jgi:hypothetical protein